MPGLGFSTAHCLSFKVLKGSLYERPCERKEAEL